MIRHPNSYSYPILPILDFINSIPSTEASCYKISETSGSPIGAEAWFSDYQRPLDDFNDYFPDRRPHHEGDLNMAGQLDNGGLFPVFHISLKDYENSA